MSLFQRRDIEDYTDSLGDYLPGGRLFAAKSINDSNFRKLLRGLAGELFRANGLLREYDILPDTTEKFLSEWESALGIPDDCFDGQGTLDERRRDILVKLASSGIQTAADFIELAAIFGVVVTVRGGAVNGIFPMVFPIIFFDTEQAARFTIIVTFALPQDNAFPLTFPILFGSGEISVLECIFEHLKPANCDILFEYS